MERQFCMSLSFMTLLICTSTVYKLNVLCLLFAKRIVAHTLCLCVSQNSDANACVNFNMWVKELIFELYALHVLNYISWSVWFSVLCFLCLARVYIFMDHISLWMVVLFPVWSVTLRLTVYCWVNWARCPPTLSDYLNLQTHGASFTMMLAIIKHNKCAAFLLLLSSCCAITDWIHCCWLNFASF